MKRIKHNQLMELIGSLKKLSIEREVNLWKRIASDLEKPTRIRREVNLYKLDRYCKENETVIVPGKVLGMGELNKKIHVAAFSFSQSAYDKINQKGTAFSIPELMKRNPSGKGVRILG
jgi:large subunit ribosomal protein L18e